MYVIHCIFPVNYEHDSTLTELQRMGTVVQQKSDMTQVLVKDIVHYYYYNTNNYLTAEESRMLVIRTTTQTPITKPKMVSKCR